MGIFDWLFGGKKTIPKTEKEVKKPKKKTTSKPKKKTTPKSNEVLKKNVTQLENSDDPVDIFLNYLQEEGDDKSLEIKKLMEDEINTEKKKEEDIYKNGLKKYWEKLPLFFSDDKDLKTDYFDLVDPEINKKVLLELMSDNVIENKNNFKDGKKHGGWVLYNRKNGNLDKKEEYLDGKLVGFVKMKDGKMNGPSKIYEEKGLERVKEMNWKDNKLNGPFTTYYENGKIGFQGNYINNKLQGSSSTYYTNGVLHEEGNWKDGSMNGLWKKYHGNSKLKSEIIYKDHESVSQKCWDEEGNETECE